MPSDALRVNVQSVNEEQDFAQLDDVNRASAPPVDPARPPVDVGWVLAGRMSTVDRGAVDKAVNRFKRTLQDSFPEFEWRMSRSRRREVHVSLPADAVALLDIGVLERDANRWDFAFVVTGVPLASQAKPLMLGGPSQALDVAVMSTAALDPESRARHQQKGERQRTISARLAALAMHLFGHLNDLPHSDDPTDFMFEAWRRSQLDRMCGFSEEAREHLRERIAEVADPREEEGSGPPVGAVRFYLRVVWPNRREIISSIRRIAPWEFPIRFTRLSTAAASTMTVLLVTAEAWELGMSQPAWRVGLLSVGALVSTSYFVLTRQHLLSRYARRLSEQGVITSVSVTLSVLMGMLTTYLMLFAVTWTATKTLFGPALVRHWTDRAAAVPESSYLLLAGFVASLGLIIGALGASFEQESYFRRVALLDEET